MAAAVLSSSKLNVPMPKALHMASHPGTDASTSRAAAASSSRLQPSISHATPSAAPDANPRTFQRLRSSLEQTIRTATKSKAKSPVPVDDQGTVSPSKGKGKERVSEEHAVPKERERTKSRMLSKVPFRRAGGRESISPHPVPPAVASERQEDAKVERDRDKDKVRKAGHTGFSPPSLRQASMSSPTLHLSSQPFPSPYSQPFALPAASSSNVAALVSPTRERVRKVHIQGPSSPKEISGPLPLASRRETRPNGVAVSTTTPVHAEKPSKSRPPPVSVPPANLFRSAELVSNDTFLPETPPRRAREATRSPDLSPPSPTPRSGYSAGTASRRAAASTSHLPLGSTPSSPTTPTAGSPNRARSASRTPTNRSKPSASTSHLPLTPPSPSPTPNARRPSLDAQRPRNFSPSPSRAASPTSPIRTRAVSPTQRNYSPTQHRHYNASATSLAAPNPEQRELIRTASSALVREMLKPPSQLRENTLDPNEWDEVEVRLRALARLERVWGKSGVGMTSSSQLGSLSSSGLSAAGEERERRHFCDAMRDGYVLCQLVNKLHPNAIPRVDRREDGFVRTSNVTKFLAACSQIGVQREDLFNRDDLIEATPEGLARVAKCVVALLQATEFPAPEKSKIMQGGQAKTLQSPYNYGTAARGAASTPNLSISHAQRSTSPTGMVTPVGRKRLSPPQPCLTPVRSESPCDSDHSSGGGTASNTAAPNGMSDGEADELPPIPKPPPRSPLRARPSVDSRVSVADSTRASIGDSVRESLVESIAISAGRQSLASSQMTDTTTYSSLLEVQRSSSSAQNTKFGTIRTITTEATSFAPSDMFSPAEGNSFFPSPTDDFPRKWGFDPNGRPHRERRPSDNAAVDLTRVVEEADESGSSAKGAQPREMAALKPEPERERPKRSAIQLGKGKWPDDFLDAFQAHKDPSPLEDEDPEESSLHTPISISPPRKLAVIGAARPDENIDSLPQFPRRPSHRARHSVDTPGLLPKESILRRDSSPDGSVSPTPRIMIRRNSTRTGPHRNGVYIPRNADDPRSSEDSLVPFPRTASGEHSTPPSQGIHFPAANPDISKAASGTSAPNDRPRQPRGRFQSEIDGSSSRRKARPNSYDELGAKPPRRSRFESMVNLGVASSNASASDLISRESYEGTAVRQTLIVREEGKPPTQFQLGNCIGRGQFGAVYRALNLNTGQMVAVKRIRLEGLKEDEIAQLMREVDLVKRLSHPSIVKYEGMVRDDDSLNIVLEYAENGSLGQTLKAFGKLNERLVSAYVVRILEGLHYLHRSDVVHCDLKAANILTTKNGNVKLSDFGVSLNLRAMEREMKDVAGTPNWMAPEVIELKGASPKSDIWSLACTVIELLTGRPPYGDIANSMSVMFRIVEDDMPPLPEGCSESLKDFLTQCFNKDPSKRPTAELLCEHEWLKRNWSAHMDLRPQDSIPFLRRVSADLQKSEAIRYLAKIEMPDPDRSTPEYRARLDEHISSSPPPRRVSNDLESISPREHSFVKTTFGKSVICRVCLLYVKKGAVLCEQCSLIAHSKCAPNAPPTCDLRAQLLLYAQYAAENGTPTSPTAPTDLLAVPQAGAPTSPRSEGGLSSRTSFDLPPVSVAPSSTPSNGHPPITFRVLSAFKRSRSSLSGDYERSASGSSAAAAPSSPTRPRVLTHKRSVLKRNPPLKERPPSIASSGTPNSSSTRSAVTAAESLSSRGDTVRQSAISIQATDASAADRSDGRLSKMTSFSVLSTSGTELDESRSSGIPGELPRAPRDRKRDKGGKSGNCIVQ